MVSGANGVVAPTDAWDWSNIADVSEYYQFGRLIPASSTNGTNIYFTPDADGSGQTIKTDAKFYTAASGGTAQTESTDTLGSGAGSKSLMATAHIINAKNGGFVTDKWNEGGTDSYTTSSSWNNTNDDGYYIDIPVWLRTSSVNGADISVKAYVKPKDVTSSSASTKIQNNSENEALYRALRVAILEETPGENGAASTFSNKTNLIPVTDGCTATGAGNFVGQLKANPFELTTNDTSNSIIDWYNRTNDGKVAVAGLVDSPAVGATNGNYGEATVYNVADANGKVVTSLAPPTKSVNGIKSDNYGAAKKLIVRVWLEGEDPDCWNDTAGQDWSINLKFNNETTASGGGANTDISGVNKDAAPKQNNG